MDEIFLNYNKIIIWFLLYLYYIDPKSWKMIYYSIINVNIIVETNNTKSLTHEKSIRVIQSGKTWHLYISEMKILYLHPCCSKKKSSVFFFFTLYYPCILICSFCLYCRALLNFCKFILSSKLEYLVWTHIKNMLWSSCRGAVVNESD